MIPKHEMETNILFRGSVCFTRLVPNTDIETQKVSEGDVFQNAFPEKTNFWQDGFARSFIWDWIAPIGGAVNIERSCNRTRFN